MSERVLRAASFAARAHAGQVRKDGATPYAAHPSRVAMIVATVFGCDDEVALCAAFLHDVIEDTGADYDDIEEGWGVEVADCVAALTKDMTLPEHVREPSYDRKLADADWRARLVKLADQYDNLSDVPDSYGAEKVATVVTKCERAIALALGDESRHPESARAVQVLRDLIDRAG